MLSGLMYFLKSNPLNKNTYKLNSFTNQIDIDPS